MKNNYLLYKISSYLLFFFLTPSYVGGIIAKAFVAKRSKSSKNGDCLGSKKIRTNK